MSSEPKDSPSENFSENESENIDTCIKDDKPKNMKPGAQKLRSWLNKTLRIEMTDGRVLLGVFLCTDRDANVILGSCSEFLPPDDDGANDEPRILGLVMIPGRHIVSVHLDTNSVLQLDEPLSPDINLETDEIM